MIRGAFRLLTYNTVGAENTACDHVNRPFGALSSHLYSCSSDSLSGPTSSETNHKGLLLGIDTILGTELYAADVSGMSDRLRKDMKQATFAPCPRKSSRLMPFILLRRIHKTQGAAL